MKNKSVDQKKEDKQRFKKFYSIALAELTDEEMTKLSGGICGFNVACRSTWSRGSCKM